MASSNSNGETVELTRSFDGIEGLTWLKDDCHFRTLIDIGANDGAYGAFLAKYFGVSKVYAFEPLQGHHNELQRLGFEVFPCALGDGNGVTTFIVNAYDAASSMLELTERTKDLFPQLAETEAIEVPLRRLDDALEATVLEDDVLIKVDTQGVEDAVVGGGRKVFARAKAVLIEVSFVPVYRGQALFNDIHDLLASCGLRLSGMRNQVCETKSHRPVFAHCIYQR